MPLDSLDSGDLCGGAEVGSSLPLRPCKCMCISGHEKNWLVFWEGRESEDELPKGFVFFFACVGQCSFRDEIGSGLCSVGCAASVGKESGGCLERFDGVCDSARGGFPERGLSQFHGSTFAADGVCVHGSVLKGRGGSVACPARPSGLQG